MRSANPPLSLNAWLRWDVLERTLAGLDGIRTVLEIGTGVGAASVRLARRYEYLGVELDPTSFEIARARLEHIGRGTIQLGDLGTVDPERRFDLVGAFEVLEHIEDDSAALRDWAARVRPGGWLMLSVPAKQDRLGAADRAAGHFRRYDREDLAAALSGAGLEEVRVLTYGFPLGYVLQPVWNLLARRHASADAAERTGVSGRWFQPRDALAPVTRVVSLPFRLAQRPFAAGDLGTGLVAIARRPR